MNTENFTLQDFVAASEELNNAMTEAFLDRETELLELLEVREAEILKLKQRIAGYKANASRRRRATA